MGVECPPIRPSDVVANKVVATEKKRWLSGLAKKVKHPKVRSGCLTCKQRRLKCDEGKPFCARCCRSGRTCSGYAGSYQQPIVQPRAGYADGDQITDDDNKLLQHFLVEATRQLSGFSLSLKEFCSSLVPQMSYHYPAVRYALLTVAAKTQAAAFRWDRRRPRREALDRKASALLYYNRAIKHLTSSDTPSDLSPAVFLVCGLLFGASELWPHIDMKPTIHVVTAFQLVVRCASMLSPEVREGLYPFLVHMGRKMLAYSDDIPPDISPALARFSWLEMPPTPVPEVFASTEQAWATMEDLYNYVGTLSRLDAAFDSEARPQALAYAAVIRESLVRTSQQAAPNVVAQYRALLMHHRTSQVMLDAELGSDEGTWDLFTADFEYILSECEELIRTQQQSTSHAGTIGGASNYTSTINSSSSSPWHCSLGILSPLFMVATRCRIASLRHRAIKALHSAKRREKEWNSCIAAMLARLVVQIEEKERQAADGGGAVIPVRCRVRLDSVVFDRNEEQITATWVNPTTEEYGTRVLSWKVRGAIDDEFECVSLSRKRLEASGYCGILLVSPPIQCQCGVADEARLLGVTRSPGSSGGRSDG